MPLRSHMCYIPCPSPVSWCEHINYVFNVFRPEVLQHTNTTCQSIIQHFILYTINIVYCQGEMFQSLLSHHSQRAWRWPSKGRNMSPWQYTIFIVYKIKCCVIDWHFVFIHLIMFGEEYLSRSVVIKIQFPPTFYHILLNTNVPGLRSFLRWPWMLIHVVAAGSYLKF